MPGKLPWVVDMLHGVCRWLEVPQTEKQNYSEGALNGLKWSLWHPGNNKQLDKQLILLDAGLKKRDSEFIFGGGQLRQCKQSNGEWESNLGCDALSLSKGPSFSVLRGYQRSFVTTEKLKGCFLLSSLTYKERNPLPTTNFTKEKASAGVYHPGCSM